METKMQNLMMMGHGEAAEVKGPGKRDTGKRARVDVTEHRNTGRVYQEEPSQATESGTMESRRAERAAGKAARRARRAGDTFDRAATGAPVYLEQGRVYGPPQRLAVDAHLSALADAAARSYARRREAMDGRTIPADQVEEIACIYHAEFARAAVASGVCPGSRAALYIPRGNPLPFGSLRVWIRATREGGSKARSYLWGHGAERRDSVSIDEPATPAALATVAEQPAGDTGAGDGETERCRTSPALRHHVRRHIRHYADCLRVFWTMSGSRKSASGLREDLRLLATAARVTRAGGVERLPDKYIGDGERANDVLKQALCRMRQRIASGDVLTTEQPEAAELIVSLSRRARKAGKYQSPAWMLATAPEQAAPAAPVAEVPATVATVTLHIPAPARN